MVFQEQFLDVIDRDTAERRFQAVLRMEPVGEERVPLADAWGRILARDVTSAVDVPSFDRSNFDGFAVRAVDTFGAAEERPRELILASEVIATGSVPRTELSPGGALSIATGGMLPRGADAVLMVEYADGEGERVQVRRAVAPGAGIGFAGTDIAAGETVLRRGDLLTSRETGVLAAIGHNEVWVWRKPWVGILSTGDELLAPGEPLRPGLIYESNSRIIADAVRELGGEPVWLGIVRDDLDQLRQRLAGALVSCDVVLLSGGTSKGQGDLSYRAVSELRAPGIVAHGVALKPGKPICLAASQGKPVVVLPGFPTSAIFTFHEFVAPVIRRLAGRPLETRSVRHARLAVKVNSEVGRTEYLLVGLVHNAGAATGDIVLTAYPLGQGSGSVTTFSRADGFVTIGRRVELVEAGTIVDVQLLSRDLQVADLVVIGSHCVGLDYLLGRLQDAGFRTKFLAVGSMAGLEAARRGECDLAGIHLLDPATGQYNRPWLSPELALVPGYGRIQGVLFRPGDTRFAGREAREAVAAALNDPACSMVNRNQGSGTRLLIDGLLGGRQPPGYAFQPRSHNAVAAAIAQGRADWGVAIRGVAEHAGLGFLPLAEECYDFVVPQARLQRPAVQAFGQLLTSAEIRRQLRVLGFVLSDAVVASE